MVGLQKSIKDKYNKDKYEKMKFVNTRDSGDVVSAPEAIVRGLAKGGGLYVPEFFPEVDRDAIEGLVDMSYAERAACIMSLFFDEFGSEELLAIATAAYSKFDGDPAPLVKLDQGLYMLELWHGPTQAFKDMALSVLPYLMTSAKQKIGDNSTTLILAATSGDTGKAALEGFRDVDGTSIVVLYPTDGVSPIQKQQMVTSEGSNVAVYGIRGNFDDAQGAVKRIFEDKDIAAMLKGKGIALSSANSISIGRLIPQVAYYFSAYADLLAGGQIAFGDKADFVVPSGNFGNILAAYYALRMGLPIGRLICASNSNNVLTDFFRSGRYDILKRPFYKTTSPSMDILISSNLERLLYELTDRCSETTAGYMADLGQKKKYSVAPAFHKLSLKIFGASDASEEQISEAVEEVFDDYGYVMDTHTAVAMVAYEEIGNDDVPTVIVSTASPYKFAADTLRALGGVPSNDEHKDLASLEKLTAMPIPDALRKLKGAKIRHDRVVDISEIADIIFR